MVEHGREFVERAKLHTEKCLADYRDEHHDDDPAEVEAYCRGFREASEAMAAVIAVYVVTR